MLHIRRISAKKKTKQNDFPRHQFKVIGENFRNLWIYLLVLPICFCLPAVTTEGNFQSMKWIRFKQSCPVRIRTTVKPVQSSPAATKKI